MTVKIAQIQKPIATDKLKTGNLSTEEKQAVDLLLELDSKLAPFRALIKEEDKVRKYLSSIAKDSSRFNPKESAVLAGNKAVVEYDAASSVREIADMDGLIAALKTRLGGYEALLPLIKINLGDVDKYMTEAERAPYIETVDGSRKFKTVKEK